MKILKKIFLKIFVTTKRISLILNAIRKQKFKECFVKNLRTYGNQQMAYSPYYSPDFNITLLLLICILGKKFST